jgi:hypothetical protein
MKRYNILLYTILLSVIGTSCTQVLDVSVANEEDRVVIEGLVTTQTKPYQVKVTRTIPLGNGSVYPVVNNARVIIADNIGNRDTLILAAPGIYRTIGPRTGVIGRTYYLSVEVGGITYYGQDKLPACTPIDSLYSQYKTAGSGIGITDDAFYLFFDGTDPANEKNYYRYIVYKNNDPVLSPSEIAVYDDRFLAPVIKGARLDGKYATGDKAKVELYSLSEAGYIFYNGLATQLQNDGGFFSTPPANAISNISGGALGFFQTSDFHADSIIVY